MAISSDRLNRLSVSQTLEMSEKSRELTKKGIDIVNMSVGQPDFRTPPHIKNAAKRAIDENYTYYSPVAGYGDLREAIAKKLKRDNDLEYKKSQIVVSNGAKQALANVILSIVNHGDEVLIPAPYWVSYAEIDKIAEGVNVFIPTTLESNFKVTPEQVEEAITYRTKAFLFSSPSNPAGSVYTRDELYELAKVFAKYEGIYVISDEIYEHINFSGKHESIAQFPFLKDRVIVINGVSKGFAMTGWRIGYLAAPEWIAKACEKLQGQFTSGASSIAQRAALAAITLDMRYTRAMGKAFLRRRNLVVELLKEVPNIRINIPQGAFYIFPEVSYYFGKSYQEYTIYNTKNLCLFLLEKAHVATVPGSAFGNPDCIRISYAAPDLRIREGIKRIKKALSLLK